MAQGFDPKFVDLVRNYTTTTGTGPLTLGSPPSGFSGIADVLSPGDAFYYTISNLSFPEEREVGRATLLQDGTVSRTPTSGVTTNFSAGTKMITLTAAAEWFEKAQQAIQQTVERPLFTDIAQMSFPASVQQIHTAGRTVVGQSAAYYVRDPDQSLYTVPGQALIDEMNWPTDYVSALLATVRIRDADGVYWTIDDDNQEIDFGHFGGVADATYDPAIANSVTGTENFEALDYYLVWRQFIREGTTGARRPILIRPGVYRVTGGFGVHKPDCLIIGDGAVLVGSPEFYINETGPNCRVQGLTLVENSGNPGNHLFTIGASGTRLENTEWRKEPSSGGYIGYVRQTSSFVKIRGFTCRGSNGVFLGGHDHIIDTFDMTSVNGDDAWVIKAATGPTYNIAISNGIARNYSSVVAFGSEIGTLGADDAERTKFCRNVTITNVIAQECSSLLFIKPGAIGEYDYRDGLLENVTVSNCALEDLTGKRFRSALHIGAARGAIVRDIRFSNIVVRARARDQGAPNCGVFMFVSNETGSGATIGNIDFTGLTIVDPYGGAPNGPSTPGYPIDHAVSIEKGNPNLGTIGRVEFRDLSLDGCRRAAVYLGLNLAGPIKLRGVTLRNYAAGALASVDNAAILNHSKIDVRDLESEPSPLAAASARGVMGDSQDFKSMEIIGESAVLPMDDVLAGNINRTYWSAPRDCWIRKIELVSWSNVVQSDTDYAALEVRNLGTSGALSTLTTKTTASGGAAILSGQKLSLNGADQFSGTHAYLPAESILMFAWTHVGAGRSVQNPTFIIHYVPYGRA